MNSGEKKTAIDQESDIEIVLKKFLVKICLKINFEIILLSGEKFSIFRNSFVKQKLKLYCEPFHQFFHSVPTLNP